MIKDRVVRVKLKKHFREQRPISYLGKITAFNDNWLVMEGKMLMLARSQPNGVQVDPKPSAIMVPRENIESIRVLPDNFKLDDLKFTTEGQQLRMIVDGQRDCYLGELGEG